jgi:hypothetical protein
MEVPDFERAQYVSPQGIDSEFAGRPIEPDGIGVFPKALLYGAGAAVVGSIGYALISLTGFMVSIVAIGIAWLIAKAMMAATGNVGGRQYQIAAMILTYFAVSCGELIPQLSRAFNHGAPVSILVRPLVLKFALLGPFLELQSGINGGIGLLILGIGLMAAWRYAAGGMR